MNTIDFETEYLISFNGMSEYNGVFKVTGDKICKKYFAYEFNRTFQLSDPELFPEGDHTIDTICLFQDDCDKFYAYYNPHSKCLQPYMYALRYPCLAEQIGLVRIEVDVSIPVYGKRAR